ncbi:MAG: IS110 family transposase, partial [Phycisphaerales bacterium]|nr:IS110 family transposase [Phycisphaerales bacterium]
MAWLTGEECGLSKDGRSTVQVYLEEMNGLHERIKKVEARLRVRTEGDPVVEKLLLIKGIGEVTAWTMRALIGQFDR